MNDNQRFIIKPDFKNLSEHKLNYKDILIYIAIRSFYNFEDKYCYPSYDAIAKRAQLSKKFVGESVKRLEGAKFLQVWRVVKRRIRHYYRFDQPIISYQKVPYQLLLDSDLTVFEKGILLLFREHCDSFYECSKSIAEIASESGLTYRTIHNQYQTLLLKGYIVECLYEDPLNNTLSKVIRLTQKLKWDFPQSQNTRSAINEAPEKPDFDINAIIKMATNMLINRGPRSNYGV